MGAIFKLRCKDCGFDGAVQSGGGMFSKYCADPEKIPVSEQEYMAGPNKCPKCKSPNTEPYGGMALVD